MRVLAAFQLSSLNVSPDTYPGGDWTVIKLDADSDMSVFVPYFVQDPGSMRAQNGTVFDLKQGESVSVNILFPPRNSDVFLLIGDYGRENWPIRAAGDVLDATWDSRRVRDGGSSVMASPKMKTTGGEWPWVVPGSSRVRGDVESPSISGRLLRDQRS